MTSTENLKKKWIGLASVGLIVYFIPLAFIFSLDSLQVTLEDTYLIKPGALPGLFLVIAILILAPILEEIAFRLWIVPRYYRAFILCVLFIQLGFFSIPMLVVNVLVIAGFLFFRKKIQAKYATHSVFIILISSLLFGLVHVFNFSAISVAAILVGISLMGLGVALSAIRLKFGVVASIVVHFLYNLAVLSPSLPSISDTIHKNHNKTLILREYGLLEKADLMQASDSGKYVCRRCDLEGVLKSSFQLFQDSSLVIFENSTSGQILSQKYSLYYSGEKSLEVVIDFLSTELKLKQRTDLVYEDVLIISDTLDQRLTLSDEERFGKLKGRSISEIAMTGTKALANNLEKNYDIKVFCDIGCDYPNTYVLDLNKSLEDNLSELTKTAGVVYKREQMKIRKVVFTTDESFHRTE